MNLLLRIFIFGVVQVTGLLRNSITGCVRVVFLIDTSESIHTADAYAGLDVTLNPGFLPEIKAGVESFINTFAQNNSCACLEVAINSFASQAYFWTNGTFVSPAVAEQDLFFVDYPHNTFCDMLQNYINNETDFQKNASGFYNDTIMQCLNNQSFFIQHALAYDNVCGRAFCEHDHSRDYCPPFPICDFTNFEAALYSAGSLGSANYAILITDGDPTIVNGTYPNCTGFPNAQVSPQCIDSFCPNPSGDCSDPIDLSRAVAAADVLKQQGTKVITITRSPPATQQGIANLLQIASCPNDGVFVCSNASKVNTTSYIVPNYDTALVNALQMAIKFAICNTNSPTTLAPTFIPTSSPTFKITNAPSPPSCCNCNAPPTAHVLLTSSPTPAFCTSTSCPPGCICLGLNVTAGAVSAGVVPDGKCFRLTCVHNCYNPNQDFSPTPVTPTKAPTTLHPTPKRNILLWLLPFLLGLSGGGGGGGGGVYLAPPQTTVVDVYHIIHGRRLLASSCVNSSVTCPNKNTYRCENHVCIPLLPCTSNDNCTSTTYCNATFHVCQARAFLHEPCDVNPCVDSLFCFSLPDRPDLVPRCVSASCINCCQCNLGEGVTCSPTPALAPGVIYRTLSPTTRRPTRKPIIFNPWLLLFLFPGGGGNRYPVGPVYRPGGTVVVDIYHIIHARYAVFVNGTRECTRIRAPAVYLTGVNMSDPCNNNPAIKTAQQCCNLCKSTITCVAWEFNSQSCPGNATLSCRLISAGSGATAFDVTAVNFANPPAGSVIGFMDTRPAGVQFCSTTADCWNPGASASDEGEGRQWCTDLGGLLPKQCLTICSADNACVVAPGLDYCWKIGLGDTFGFCVAGIEHCLCTQDQSICNTTTVNPACCPQPITCCDVGPL